MAERTPNGDSQQPISSWIGTSNRGFSVYGQEELRREFPQMAITQLLPGEWYRFDVQAARSDVIASLRAREPVFVRHVHPIDYVVRPDDAADPAELERQIVDHVYSYRNKLTDCKVAVQVRKSAGESPDIPPSQVKASIESALQQLGAIPVVRESAWIVSVTAARGAWFVGLSRPDDNLSDWPGGAVRFRREEGQLSRAKFKLLEAEYVFGLDLSHYRNALDIGAAPGGWTSLLLERGVDVTAIDPAELHESLRSHPRLTSIRRNAADVRLPAQHYDLLVCDMSWNPRLMASALSNVVPALRPGGTAIVTVKLMHKKPFQTIRDTIDRLSPGLELQRAKQLFHNREELTLFMIRSEFE